MADKFKKPGLMDGMGEGDDDDFKNDPESGGNGKYRLPFALCKEKGIPIQDWWTPRDAWAALKNGGYVDDVDEEYAKRAKEAKREKEKEWRKNNPDIVKQRQERARIKKAQLKNPEHNPDKSYVHQDGKIAGAAKGKPMTHEQADSGNVNPYYGTKQIGYMTNCQTCVATYVARRQGYDVRALPNLNNRSIYALTYNTSLAYIDKDGKRPKTLYKHNSERKDKWLEKNVKSEEIYALAYDYIGKSYGHIVIVEKINVKGKNVLKIYDPQSNKMHSDVKEVLSETTGLRLTNLTNCRIDEKFCDKIMKRRTK